MPPSNGIYEYVDMGYVYKYAIECEIYKYDIYASTQLPVGDWAHCKVLIYNIDDNEHFARYVGHLIFPSIPHGPDIITLKLEKKYGLSARATVLDLSVTK